MSTPNEDYGALKADLLKVMKQPDYDDGSAGPILVRLAWHASGTYDKESGTGGSNGAGMRYESEGGDEANAGLQHARAFLEPVKAKYEWVSYADLWTLAGVTAVEAMGGPDIEWKPGRTDFADESFCPPRGRLPDGAQAADHLRDVFYRMGFDDQEIVALSGAHSLGRCHSDRSGFHGPWTITPTKFSNQYYKMLTKFEWTEKSWPGEPDRPLQYKNEDLGEELMMLPTDLALVQDDAFRPHVERYAADKDLFFADFAKAFAKLIELGVDRSMAYKAAPKKADEPAHPEKGQSFGKAKL